MLEVTHWKTVISQSIPFVTYGCVHTEFLMGKTISTGTLVITATIVNVVHTVHQNVDTANQI